PQVRESFERAISSGLPYDQESRLRRSDGAYRWFQMRGLPIRDAFSRIASWYFLLTDIDDRKHAEDAVAANERNLSLILNTIGTPIHVVGVDGSVLYVNQAVLDDTGLTAEDVWKEDYYARLIHHEDLTSKREQRQAALKQPTPFELEMRIRLKDASYHWF